MLADRNFCGYPVRRRLAATGADLLIRARADHRAPGDAGLTRRIGPNGWPTPPPPAAATSATTTAAPAAAPCPRDRLHHRGHRMRPHRGRYRRRPADSPTHTERYRLITTLAGPGGPRRLPGRLLRPAVGIGPSYREIKTFTLRPAACCARPARQDQAGNLGPALRRPARPDRPRQSRRRRMTTTPTASPTPSPCAPCAARSPPPRRTSPPKCSPAPATPPPPPPPPAHRRQTANAAPPAQAARHPHPYQITITRPSPDQPGP